VAARTSYQANRGGFNNAWADYERWMVAAATAALGTINWPMTTVSRLVYSDHLNSRVNALATSQHRCFMACSVHPLIY
jgi:hypothetical protein